MQQAQETFIAVLDDGTERRVAKGEVLPDRHELVIRDQNGAGVLFRPLDMGEDETPPPKTAGTPRRGKAS